MTDLEMATSDELVAELKKRFPGVVIAARCATADDCVPYNMIWQQFDTPELHDEIAVEVGRWAADWLEGRLERGYGD